jgi:hypothetical protein
MPDQLAPDERALIDAAIAAGKVRQVPRGASSYVVQYVYKPMTRYDGAHIGKLVCVDPDGWKEQRKREWRIKQRGDKARMAKGRATALAAKRAKVEARREHVARLIETYSQVEIAKQLGVSAETIRFDVKALKAEGRA